MFRIIITFVTLSHRYLPYCSVHTSLYLALHHSHVVTSRVLLLLRRTSCSTFLYSPYSVVPFPYVVIRVCLALYYCLSSHNTVLFVCLCI